MQHTSLERLQKYVYWSCWSVILILVAALCVNPISDTDVFMYLAIVREYFNTGAWPATDPFSVKGLSSGPAFHFDTWHEWGSYFIFYLFNSVFGVTGLLILKTSLIVLAYLAPFYYSIRSKVHSGWVLTASVLAVYVSSTRMGERSSLFGDLFGLLVLVILLSRKERCKPGLKSGVDVWNGFLLPFLFLVWVNLHPSFPVGLILIFLSLLVDTFQALEADKNFLKSRTFRKRTYSFLLCLLACFCNPKGVAGFLYPFSFLLNEAVFLKQSNLEWTPIWNIRFYKYWELTRFYWEAAIVAGILLNQLIRKGAIAAKHGKIASLPLFELLAFSMITFLGLSSVRFALFSSVGLLIILTRLIRISEMNSQDQSQLEVGKKNRLNLPWAWKQLEMGLAAACMISALTSIVQLSLGEYQSGFDLRKIGVGLDRRYFPVESLEFIEKLYTSRPNLGNIFNTYWLGCYLAWRWNGKHRVFAHGFMTDSDFIGNDYLAMVESIGSFERITQKYSISVLLLGKEMRLTGLLELMRSLPDWLLVFEDPATYVFVKKTHLLP